MGRGEIIEGDRGEEIIVYCKESSTLRVCSCFNQVCLPQLHDFTIKWSAGC